MHSRHNRRDFVRLGAAGLAMGWLAPRLAARTLPASVGTDGRELNLGNHRIRARWRVGPAGVEWLDVRAGALTLPVAAPAFSLRLGDETVPATALVAGPPRTEHLEARPDAACLAERLPGRALALHLADPAGRFQVDWRAELRDGSHYIRQIVTVQAAGSDVPLDEITLVSLPADGVSVTGTVAGSPFTRVQPEGGWFAACEHPLALHRLDGGRALGSFRRALPLAAGQSASYSSVVGVVAAGQMRRDFLAYVERERAHPYRPFLHYNSWFDLGYFTPYDEAGCLDVIAAFGRELYTARHVRLDSFLFDDGWDNHQDWDFNAGFPRGFTAISAAAAAIGAAPGMWLSPWGGYGAPRQERLAFAAAHGYEINREGLALSGPVYYRLFHDACLRMIRQYGVNQFKLDGTGSTAAVVPGSAFGSDFEAAIALIGDMRAAEPGLFINLTTGTYPSPFWLRYADSTWRGGSDTAFAGVGTDRQQWITYRDADTFRHVVGRGPLYPLNSLMLHGIVYARHARRLDTDPGQDFDAEVRAYFGTGTQLQEMYISHGLLAPGDWDVLAEAAQWARRNAATLLDTHWIGGDPAQLEPYGHAAWSRENAIVTLRNPADRPQSFALDVAAAFELPHSAPTRFRLHSPWRRDQWRQPQPDTPIEFEAGRPLNLTLRPFEVLTLQARSLTARAVEPASPQFTGTDA